ncbi:Endoplasmic reticulum aminopeptidase 1 [Portunus trituberculatus]|uniref:Endoplasmic reticulum aminopeptidase 1 n=1 Tax=Portunus trituberculatus TaxID=210409 RepID=A0A5B7F5K1_PORTR|nr:Endoplasmic reticulum aminopeptidase 1 [Portunus trituberculatus]
MDADSSYDDLPPPSHLSPLLFYVINHQPTFTKLNQTSSNYFTISLSRFNTLKTTVSNLVVKQQIAVTLLMAPSQPSPTMEFEVGKDVKWVKFNVGQRGFFRVSYDAAGWAGLISLLRNNHTALSSADRANLVDDIFTLVK